MREENRVQIGSPYLLGKDKLLEKLGMDQESFENITNPKHKSYDPDFPQPISPIIIGNERYSSIDMHAYIQERERFCNRVVSSAHMCLGQELIGEAEIVKKSSSAGLSCGVYFLIKDNKIVYVGQSKKLLSRVGSHLREDSGKFDSFSFISCSESKLDILESMYIHMLRPKLNNTDPVYHDSPMRAPISEVKMMDILGSMGSMGSINDE